MKHITALYLFSLTLFTPAFASINESQFNEIITRTEKVYSPIFQKEGLKLVIHNLWPKDTKNASASEWKWVKGIANVNLYGGLARDALMTYDGYLLTTCHEFGHHIGGAPRSPRNVLSISEQMTIEGQADYYATLKCLRTMFEGDDNAAIVAKMDVPVLVIDKCSSAFATKNEIALCERSAMAGLAMAKVLAALSKDKDQPSFDTPSNKAVQKTFSGHSFAQCRLDTFLAGAICERKVDEALSKADPRPGTCNESQVDKTGFRPTCWYKENLSRDSWLATQAAQ